MKKLFCIFLAIAVYADLSFAQDPTCLSRERTIDCFAVDGAQLTEQQRLSISVIADEIITSYRRKNKTINFVLIKGFGVPWPGSDPQQMAQQRASAVKQQLESVLTQRGMLSSNVNFMEQPIVETNPRIKNNNQHRRALNRRVEISFQRPDGLVGETLNPSTRDYLQLLRIKHNDLKLSTPLPKSAEIDITGLYHADYLPKNKDYKNNRTVLRINQAGKSVKVWYTRYIAKEGQLTEHKNAMGFGRVIYEKNGMTRIQIKLKGDETFTAQLMVDHKFGGSKLTMLSESHDWTFSRLSKNAIHSDRYLVDAGNKKINRAVKRDFDTPILNDDFHARLKLFYNGKNTSSPSFVGLLRKFAENRSEKITQPGLVKKMNARYAKHILMGISLAHTEFANRWINDQMGMIEFEPGQTYLDVMDQLCTQYSINLIAEMVRVGGLCTPSFTRHEYKWEFVAAGKSQDLLPVKGRSVSFVNGEAHAGTFRIKKIKPKAWKKWQKYPAILAGVGLGVDIDVSGSPVVLSKFKGIATSKHNWKPANIPGQFYISGVDLAEIKLGFESKSISTYGIQIYGDGDLLSLWGDVDSSSTGLGIGAGGKAFIGKIFGTEETQQKYVQFRRQKLKKTKVPVKQYGKQALHFEVDETTLTEKGRNVIARMLADQLASIQKKDLKLKIIGHASPSGPADHNYDLSIGRAINVLQAIEDILGTKIQIDPKNTKVIGHGEKQSAKALGSNSVESDEWRRVDITLAGITLLTLHSP